MIGRKVRQHVMEVIPCAPCRAYLQSFASLDGRATEEGCWTWTRRSIWTTGQVWTVRHWRDAANVDEEENEMRVFFALFLFPLPASFHVPAFPFFPSLFLSPFLAHAPVLFRVRALVPVPSPVHAPFPSPSPVLLSSASLVL